MENPNVWYLAIDGHQVGPMSKEELVAKIQEGTGGQDTLVFGPGMREWKKARDVAEVSGPAFGTNGSGAGAPPPVAPGRRAHEIDFKIQAPRCSSSRSSSTPASARSPRRVR